MAGMQKRYKGKKEDSVITKPLTPSEIENEIESIINRVCEFFKINEVSNFKSHAFVVSALTMISNSGKIEEFEKQFEAYKAYKQETRERLHDFENYFGDLKEGCENGAWCKYDWAQKLNSENNENETVEV